MSQYYETLEKIKAEAVRRTEQLRYKSKLVSLLAECGVDAMPIMNHKYELHEIEDLLRKSIQCLQERISTCNRAYKKLQRKNDTLAQQALSFMTQYENKISDSTNENRGDSGENEKA